MRCSRFIYLLAGLSLAFTALCAACKDSSDVQTLVVHIDDGGCAPAAASVAPGRRLRIEVENEAAAAYTLRDGDGRLDELTVGAGESAEEFFDVPDGSGTYLLLCESDAGAVTEIRLDAGVPGAASPSATGDATSTPTQAEADGTLAVSLLDFEISPSEETIRTGRYNIIATNVSDTSTHELNVLQLQPDGSFVPRAEIAPMAPQQGGAVLTALGPGTYRLACQIAPGEFGSTVDHYQQGMWFDIVVLPEEG